MERKTPLYDCHVSLGGKIVPFSGYLLPVQYPSGVITEHLAVRAKAGLFDVSHMGEVLYTGPDALKNLNYLLTNDFSDMSDGQVRYSPMCNERGGIVDDLVVYKLSDEKYMLVVNASNREKDVAWMKGHLFGEVKLKDTSDDMAQIALQGPLSREILGRVAAEASIPVRYYSFIAEGTAGGIPCIISRTGYTGELGYEIYTANADAARMWNLLLDAGRDLGLLPCGLGARDTLRLEAAMPLYGHEMNDDISPLETGLGSFVKAYKEDFVGKKAIAQKGDPTRRRVGLKVTGRGIARENEKVFADGKEIGHTTSGTYCPYIACAAAMAILDIGYAKAGTGVEIEVRGRRLPAEVAALPFYKRERANSETNSK